MRWIGTALVSVVLSLLGLTGPETWVGDAGAKIASHQTTQEGPGRILARSTAPTFELVTFAGEVYSNQSLRGRPVLLAFWAPWCNVCQRELPLLSAFYQREKPAQLGVVSVGFADTRAHVEQFVRKHSDTFVFPSAYDEDRWVAQAFKVNATPTYVLVDAQGSIVLVHRGGGIFQSVQFREFVSTLSG